MAGAQPATEDGSAVIEAVHVDVVAQRRLLLGQTHGRDAKHKVGAQVVPEVGRGRASAPGPVVAHDVTRTVGRKGGTFVAEEWPDRLGDRLRIDERLVSLDIDDDVAVQRRGDFGKAIGAAKKPGPEKSTILSHLAQAKSLLETAGAAAGVITALAQAAEGVQRLF